MQITDFRVCGLFGRYDHVIPFASDNESKHRPSVTIIHGPNGVGKTTLLRMLDGMMELNFTEFRRVPFASASLSFNTGDTLRVTRVSEDARSYLHVVFAGTEARLDPEHSGPLDVHCDDQVKQFRERFHEKTSGIRFELIETTRLLDLDRQREPAESGPRWIMTPSGRRIKRTVTDESGPQLAQRVYHFINEAQADYRRFFSAHAPESWLMMLKRLTQEASIEIPTPEELNGRLTALQLKEQKIESSGLRDQESGLSWVKEYLDEQKDRAPDEGALPLTVLTTYLGLLESRMTEQLLLAERLITFEHLLSDFLSHKRVIVSAENGFVIETSEGHTLSEHQLSSGEYHLLYLMVGALVARRRGTVIAIDEPELSMHISWQRKLVSALCDCAAGAEPQFVFATHSPDLVREFKEGMVKLGDIASDDS